MSPADLDLARELAAHPRWEWRAGMRIVSRFDGALLWRRAEGDLAIHPDWGTEPVPDLHDPTGATAGVLLAMLREATPDVVVSVVYAGGWLCDPGEHEGPTLGVAVARALLAAWGAA